MRPLTVSIFVVILVVTLANTYWVARRTRTASEFCRTRRKEH
jgi:Na+(H+)/acetate symporter ActP